MQRIERIPEAREFLDYVKAITVKPDKYRREIVRLHKGRLLRELSLSKNVSVKKLNQVSTQESAIRSRATEVMLECKRLLDTSKEYMDGVIIQMIATKPSQIDGSSKEEKAKYLRFQLTVKSPVLRELQDCYDTCDYVINDLDQAKFDVQRLVKLYELQTRPDLT